MGKTEQLKRMHELVRVLNVARRAYEQENHSVMSDFEYDKLYDELLVLEKALGTTLASSPTINVGYEVMGELPKEEHESPMLSLDKTKDVMQLVEFLSEQIGVISWKLDGLTVVLTYRNGKLEKGVTRGNGEIGEVITNNVRTFRNLPLEIPFQGELVLRGEAVIGYKDFNQLNEEMDDDLVKYKNPRNLCSGSVRQLNNEITAQRHVHFWAFHLVRAEGKDWKNSRKYQMDWLEVQGFEVVEHHLVQADTLEAQVADFAKSIESFDLPTDGLVLTYDDIAYGKSLGSTNKFPRDSIAFKWADEVKDTTLLEIAWSPSRTGLINPIAIFNPVELEGTTVSRASVHNISILEELELGIGDIIQVYKANMIIPQIAENITRSGVKDIPMYCPVCDAPTEIKTDLGTKTLHCPNPNCQAKALKLFALFVSRNAMNIEGLSEASLEKFVEKGFIKDVTDIFRLQRYAAEIKSMEGFGEKSYFNLMQSIKQAKTTTLPKLIFALGIPNVGLATAKVICKAYANDPKRLLKAKEEELSQLFTIGTVIAKAFVDYFAVPENKNIFLTLLDEVELPDETQEVQQDLAGKIFVITGNVTQFANRNAAKEFIESRGGKVSGSVSFKTDYLINNDVHSTSSKNKKAKELNVPIITEAGFIEMFGKV
ncbi:MAG: NAD-dependent DNA ligase LigA [Lachnospiraceae bacterium]|nr:NAD-dependent DNA ligase LigA [Lachnospiraceae bacterium]